MLRAACFFMIALGSLAACSPPPDSPTETPESAELPAGPEAKISGVASGDIPAAVRAAALAKIPGMKIAEAERWKY